MENPNTNVPSNSVVQDGKEHIHPCICDDKKNRKRLPLTGFELKKKTAQYLRRFTREDNIRLGFIDVAAEEAKLKAKEERKRLREEEEKKKAKERTAMHFDPVAGTNYGMVYLFDQNEFMDIRKGHIKWKNDPKITVRPNKTSKLRKEYRRYCGKELEFLKRQASKDEFKGHKLPPPPPPMS